MGIRMVCIIACFFVTGWWLLIPALGAIFLPYFAVIIANESGNRNQTIINATSDSVALRENYR